MILVGILILISLTSGAIIYYNFQSSQINELSAKSSELNIQWQRLQNRTYRILLDRFTLSEQKSPQALSIWKNEYELFSSSLTDISDNNSLEKLNGIPQKLERINRVWRYTEIKLNNAENFFSEIILSGLGEKVMVTGFLHTMYKLRMTGQLNMEEILLLDDTIYALKTLDNASREFDILFKEVLNDLNNAGEDYLAKVKYSAFGFLISFLITLSILIFLFYQHSLSQKNLNIYLNSLREELLFRICEDSNEDNLRYFNECREKIDIEIVLDIPLVPLSVQIDDYSLFSHTHNINEQHILHSKVIKDLSEILTQYKTRFESFSYSHDIMIFLVNTINEDSYEMLHKRLETDYKKILERSPFSFTLSYGNLCTDPIDLDREVSGLLSIASYRFISGKGSFLFSGSSYLTINNDFHYPIEKEKLFEEAMKSLDHESTIDKLNKLIDYGFPFGPQNMRRLIIRLTACLSSLVESLEKTYHITTIERVTPMILQVQTPETLEEVRALLVKIVDEVLTECKNRKEEKHDQTVQKIKDYIKRELRDFNLSADWLADQVHLTTAYINRLFKQHTGLSIAGYINEVRLDKAAEALKTGEKTIVEISEESGFSSSGTFFRLFKKRFGRSPNEYRKNILEAVRNSDIQESVPSSVAASDPG